MILMVARNLKVMIVLRLLNTDTDLNTTLLLERPQRQRHPRPRQQGRGIIDGLLGGIVGSVGGGVSTIANAVRGVNDGLSKNFDQNAVKPTYGQPLPPGVFKYDGNAALPYGTGSAPGPDGTPGAYGTNLPTNMVVGVGAEYGLQKSASLAPGQTYGGPAYGAVPGPGGTWTFFPTGK